LLIQIDQNIKNGTVTKPTFILVLGDLVGHHRSIPDFAMISESAVFRALKNHFPTIPILYTFGNNDSLEVDYGVFTTAGLKPYTNPYDIAKAKGGWVDGALSTGTQCTVSK